MGGLFSIFHTKSASKAQKTCDFAYFTSQWGGSSPPRPGYATVDRLDGTTFKLFKVVTLELTPKKFGVKEVAFKKHRKNISDGYIYLKIPFHPYQPTFGGDEFFFSSNIPYAYFLNGTTPKKNCIKLYYRDVRTTYVVQTMQTKFARFRRKSSGYLVGPPQRFRQIDTPAQ